MTAIVGIILGAVAQFAHLGGSNDMLITSLLALLDAGAWIVSMACWLEDATRFWRNQWPESSKRAKIIFALKTAVIVLFYLGFIVWSLTAIVDRFRAALVGGG
jgi:membrane protease YdiL (CAAX protease family)